MLAHELGHALGHRDNVSPKDVIGNNVRFVENPIRGEFGLPLRISYHVPVTLQTVRVTPSSK